MDQLRKSEAMGYNRKSVDELVTLVSAWNIPKIIWSVLKVINRDEVNAKFEFGEGKIREEFMRVRQELEGAENIITIMGARNGLKEGDHYYEMARELAGKLQKNQYSVISTGRRGIGDAVRKGYNQARNGITLLTARGSRLIYLGRNKDSDRKDIYPDNALELNYQFMRKNAIVSYSQAIILFPGSSGTFDVLAEILTLMQNRKVPRVPILLVGEDFWDFDEIAESLLRHKTISPEDLRLFVKVGSVDEILNILEIDRNGENGNTPTNSPGASVTTDNEFERRPIEGKGQSKEKGRVALRFFQFLGYAAIFILAPYTLYLLNEAHQLGYIFTEFLPIFGEAWVLISIVLATSLIQGRNILKFFILTVGVALSFGVFHGFNGTTEYGNIVQSILIRFGSVFAGVFAVYILKGYLKGAKEELKKVVTSAQQWKEKAFHALGFSMVSGYFLYYLYLPFMASHFSDITLRVIFDLSVASVVTFTLLEIALSGLFVSGKNLFVQFKGFLKTLPFAILVFGPFLYVVWTFVPEAYVNFAHGAFVPVWMIILTLITRENFEDSKINKPGLLDEGREETGAPMTLPSTYEFWGRWIKDSRKIELGIAWWYETFTFLLQPIEDLLDDHGEQTYRQRLKRKQMIGETRLITGLFSSFALGGTLILSLSFYWIIGLPVAVALIYSVFAHFIYNWLNPDAPLTVDGVFKKLQVKDNPFRKFREGRNKTIRPMTRPLRLLDADSDSGGTLGVFIDQFYIKGLNPNLGEPGDIMDIRFKLGEPDNTGRETILVTIRSTVRRGRQEKRFVYLNILSGKVEIKRQSPTMTDFYKYKMGLQNRIPHQAQTTIRLSNEGTNRHIAYGGVSYHNLPESLGEIGEEVRIRFKHLNSESRDLLAWVYPLYAPTTEPPHYERVVHITEKGETSQDFSRLGSDRDHHMRALNTEIGLDLTHPNSSHARASAFKIRENTRIFLTRQRSIKQNWFEYSPEEIERKLKEFDASRDSRNRTLRKRQLKTILRKLTEEIYSNHFRDFSRGSLIKDNLYEDLMYLGKLFASFEQNQFLAYRQVRRFFGLHLNYRTARIKIILGYLSQIGFQFRYTQDGFYVLDAPFTFVMQTYKFKELQEKERISDWIKGSALLTGPLLMGIALLFSVFTFFQPAPVFAEGLSPLTHVNIVENNGFGAWRGTKKYPDKRHEGVDFKQEMKAPVYLPDLPFELIQARDDDPKSKNGHWAIALGAIEKQLVYKLEFLHLDKLMVRSEETNIASGMQIGTTGRTGYRGNPAILTHQHVALYVADLRQMHTPINTVLDVDSTLYQAQDLIHSLPELIRLIRQFQRDKNIERFMAQIEIMMAHSREILARSVADPDNFEPPAHHLSEEDYNIFVQMLSLEEAGP